VERLGRWCRRNRVVAGLSLASAALLAAVAVLTVLALSRPRPQDDDSWRRVQNAGVLRIATDPTYPPMEFREGGRLVGFDVDLGRALAERLGVEAEFVEVAWDWDALADRLSRREFDVLLSSAAVTDERRASVDFVEYLTPSFVFVCRRGVSVRGENDLAGKVVAVMADTPAQRRVKRLQEAGLAIKEVLVFPAAPACFDAVAGGRADVTIDLELAARYYERKDDRLHVTETLRGRISADAVGIACRKQDRQLQAKLREALGELKKEGGPFDELLAKWLAR
jgi:ABC-type amino acid transport substrate-binding protein